MAEDKPAGQVDDEDLLNNAIPISELDSDELLQNAIPIDQAEQNETVDSGQPEALDLAEAEEGQVKRKIQAFGPTSRHEEKWNRTPNTTGQGAIHVKTFVSKLRLDAIDHLDQVINEWLDANPQYEVKLVTTSIGELVGKTREQALFMSVWV